MENAPIIVTGPAPRSGTTLVQRLLSGSDNAICYGEDATRRLLSLVEFTHSEILGLQERANLQSFYIQNLLAGDGDFSGLDLELPGEMPKHALVGALTFFKQHYDEATKAIEKDIWASKTAETSFLNVVKAADFIPDLKCIYIYRNIIDTISSQKALGLVKTEEELATACAIWVKNTDVIAALSRKNFQQVPAMLHPVCFEDLIANSETEIRKIEDFSGVKNIDRSVMGQKTNHIDQVSETDPTPIPNYIEPAPLSEIELSLIAHICDDRMQEIYPDQLENLRHAKLEMH